MEIFDSYNEEYLSKVKWSEVKWEVGSWKKNRQLSVWYHDQLPVYPSNSNKNFGYLFSKVALKQNNCSTVLRLYTVLKYIFDNMHFIYTILYICKSAPCFIYTVVRKCTGGAWYVSYIVGTLVCHYTGTMVNWYKQHSSTLVWQNAYTTVP